MADRLRAGRYAAAAATVAAAPRPSGRVRSLRIHLVGLVLLAMLPSIAISTLTAVQAIDAFSRTYEDGLQDTAQVLAAALDREIETLSTALKALATSPDLDEGGNLASFHQRAKDVALALRTVVALRRPDETMLVNTMLGPNETNAAAPDPEVFRQTVATGHGQVTNVYRGEITKGPLASVYEPVIRYGRVVAVLSIGIYPSRMSATMETQTRRYNLTAAVADGRGVVIGRSQNSAEKVGFSLVPWLTDGMAGKFAGLLRGTSREGVAVSAAFAHPTHAPSWLVVICEPLSAYDSSWRAPLLARMAASLIALSLAVAAAIWLGQGLSRPLAAVTAHPQASAYGAEPPATEIPKSSVAEFEALRASLSRAEAVLRRRGAAERMALQEARTGHELLASVVNGTADLIYVKDLELAFVLANRAALAMGGVRREEWQVLGRRSVDLIPSEPALAEEVLDREVIGTGEMRAMNVEWAGLEDGPPGASVPSEPGTMRILALTKTPWRDAEGVICGVVTVARDVTRQRAAELRLTSVQGELLRASRLSAMGAMASGLAHELNQPLAAATNFLNAAARLLDRAASNGTPAPESARGAVSDAAQQTLRAGAIVRRLRDFIGRGEAELQAEDMADLIREACEVARADGAGRQSRLVVNVPPLVGHALVDRTQLQQVLLNLIRNAGEALSETPNGLIEVTADRTPAGEVRISVADNGPGLAPDVAARLFQPFVSTKQNGMGIGLAICGTIIEGHGGRLTAGANPGGGAVFLIVLPPVELPNDAQGWSE